MSKYRIEKDSLGEMRVPESAYYGAQTARAVENFPVSGIAFPRHFIRALGIIKRSCARANVELGDLDAKVGEAIAEAATEVIEGKLDAEFLLDIYQTGSGTSTNMNANEVIANRAAEIMGKERGHKSIHPNDHVNMSQSSNDVIPTTIHVAAATAIATELIPALEHLGLTLEAKAEQFDDVRQSLLAELERTRAIVFVYEDNIQGTVEPLPWEVDDSDEETLERLDLPWRTLGDRGEFRPREAWLRDHAHDIEHAKAFLEDLSRRALELAPFRKRSDVTLRMFEALEEAQAGIFLRL